jgi:putative membrane protein
VVKKFSAEMFFSEAENLRIRDAIENAESESAGEIVVMVAGRSDEYREAELLGSVLTGALLAFIVEIVFQILSFRYALSGWNIGSGHTTEVVLAGISLWTYIPLAVTLFFPVRALFRLYEPMKLSFVGRSRMEEAVKERAVRAFYEKGLYRTRDETGILIFLSLLERKVWILGDRGINSKIPQTKWQDFAGEITGGLREGRACDALCSVISACGKELARHFPRRSDDVNELGDEVIH